MKSNNGFVLKNERLKVMISNPGSEYKNSRFDWTGMITEINLDEQISYCQMESLIEGEGTGGRGLSNEFGIHAPVGYEDCKVGEKFPKLGIGLLTRPDEAEYQFYRNYEIEPYNITTTKGKDFITFEIDTPQNRGYAIKQTKTISIKDNVLTINYFIKNNGTKEIHTTEYCHNFVAVNNCKVGPDYELRFSFKPEFVQKPEKDFLTIEDEKLKWNKIADSEFYCQLQGFNKEKGDFWEIYNKELSAGIRETVDFKVTAFAVWGREHVISPEAFVEIDLKRGESKSWSRTYQFFSTK